MQVPLINIKNLHLEYKVFGGELKVLDGVNFTVEQGEKVGLVGEAGCGKTTTMKAIMRILDGKTVRITKGEILFKGKDILKVDKKELQEIRRNKISMIFQDPTAALNPVFTIRSQIGNILKYSEEKLTKKEMEIRLVEILEKVMLPDPKRILNSYPIQLSGGMRQRVCTAMALLSKLELLIADEVGTSLDVTIKDQVLRLLDRLVNERGISVILISHALGMVKNITERTYVMYAGSMVEVAKTKELFEKPLHPYSQGLIASIPKLTGGGISRGIPGRIPNYLNATAKECRFYTRCSYAKRICKIEKPPFFKVGESHQVACWLFKKKEGQVGK